MDARSIKTPTNLVSDRDDIFEKTIYAEEAEEVKVPPAGYSVDSYQAKRRKSRARNRYVKGAAYTLSQITKENWNIYNAQDMNGKMLEIRIALPDGQETVLMYGDMFKMASNKKDGLGEKILFAANNVCLQLKDKHFTARSGMMEGRLCIGGMAPAGTPAGGKNCTNGGKTLYAVNHKKSGNFSHNLSVLLPELCVDAGKFFRKRISPLMEHFKEWRESGGIQEKKDGSQKKDPRTYAWPIPDCLGGSDGVTTRLVISRNLTNPSHNDMGDGTMSLSFWVECGGEGCSYLLFPNLDGGDNKPIALRLYTGALVLWDGRCVQHCSVSQPAVDANIYGIYFGEPIH